MPLADHLKIGARGEQLAARYLRDKGYHIFASGFTTNLGETDIIAIQNKTVICFIEVKTRSKEGMFPPSDAVDINKQNRLINNAAAFLKRNEINYSSIRFDIIEIILHDLYTADINHIINAFGQDSLK